MRRLYCLPLLLCLLAAMPVGAALRIAFISRDDSGRAMGAFVGIVHEARTWAGPGKDIDLICLAGIKAPPSLRQGIATALGRGADAIIVWPRHGESDEIASLRTALETSGKVRLYCPPDLPSANDSPASVPRLREGEIAFVQAPPADDWGRYLVYSALCRLDPDAVGVMQPVIVPQPSENFTRDKADAYAERWSRWLAQPARDYALGGGRADE